MKKISLYIILAFFTLSTAFAQVDRSNYPEPGPAPTINIGDADTFTLPNGLKVFVVENHKLPRVTFSLILDRDPILEGNKAGLTSMVGELMRSGTKSRTKDQLDEAIDQIGGSISVSSTSASASSLSKHTETLLTLFSDVLFNPSFPTGELDKIKKQYISGLAAGKDDPNNISSRVTNAVLYGKNHPFGELETEVTIGN
ncbi:MAG TPA: insulinase family protein, partial [Sphingobacteriaceae bacterium]|nr:insulinase family protein [Sphingobacteriaceae bacterium]